MIPGAEIFFGAKSLKRTTAILYVRAHAALAQISMLQQVRNVMKTIALGEGSLWAPRLAALLFLPSVRYDEPFPRCEAKHLMSLKSDSAHARAFKVETLKGWTLLTSNSI